MKRPPTPRPTEGAGARRRAALLAACLAGAACCAAAEDGRLGVDLQGLLQHARGASPELAVMRLEAEAALQRVQPAGALPDPVFRVEFENFSNIGSPADPNLLPARIGATRYTLIQPLPAWGKRGLRRDVAEQDAQQAAARADAAWTELALRIKSVHAQAHLVAGSERLAREQIDLVARIEQVAQARYAGGLAPQQDAIRAQIEQTAMRSELIGLESEKRRWRARLNALLGREAGAPLADPDALRPVPPMPQVAALAQRAREANPLLRAEEARLRSAERNVELTLRNRWPDWQLGLTPMQERNRLASVTLMVELNIPLQQDTRRAQEAESRSMVAAAQARIQALANQLEGELGEAVAALDAARRGEALATAQLLPQSELGLRSALAGYESGRGEFAALLEAQRQIRRARLEVLKARVEAQMRLAEIERIVGDDL